MKHVKKLHRAATWVAPLKDAKGEVTTPGHHRTSLRAWLRAQTALHPKLIGKARSIVESA